MEERPPASRHHSTLEPTKTETAVMPVGSPRDEADHRQPEDDTPIFREPQWNTADSTSADGPARPVLLQPPAREDRMKQQDKDLVARLDRGSSSSESDSPASPDSRTPLPHLDEESEEGVYQDRTRQESRYASLPLLPQIRPYRTHSQQKRPTPLVLSPAGTGSSHQPSLLPSLTRLVPSADLKRHRQPVRSRAQQDQRGFPRMAKQVVNSPGTYGSFTPIQVVPSWQGIPYGWTPVPMPIQVPIQAQVASPHHVFSPQTQRMHTQQQTPSSASTITPISTSSPVPLLRDDLWRVGGQYLCNPKSADAFVRAVDIRHSSTTSNSSAAIHGEDHMDIAGSDENSPSSSPGISSNPFGNTLLLRVVIHSPNHASVAMTREFDRRKLRDTIPDFAKSPRSPKSGTTFGEPSTPISINSPASLARRRKSQIRAQQAAVPGTPISAGPTKRLTMPPVPIHLPFARAHAPALAAVLLLREMRKGDSVDLPVPFPGAWLETVGYMYTGSEELLTERVMQNLWYLGGEPNSVS